MLIRSFPPGTRLSTSPVTDEHGRNPSVLIRSFPPGILPVHDTPPSAQESRNPSVLIRSFPPLSKRCHRRLLAFLRSQSLRADQVVSAVNAATGQRHRRPSWSQSLRADQVVSARSGSTREFFTHIGCGGLCILMVSLSIGGCKTLAPFSSSRSPSCLCLAAAPPRRRRRAPTPTRSSPATRRPATSASPCRATGSRSGPTVPWAEAGVGAVATQSFAKVDYGPLGLALMRAGKSAARGARRASSPPTRRRTCGRWRWWTRQGRVAAWTGPEVHRRRRPPDGRRLLGAGEPDGQADRLAGHGARLRGRPGGPRRAPAGGARGRRGRGRRHPRPAERGAPRRARASRPASPGADRLVDLRVDDHPQPLVELRRLLDPAPRLRGDEPGRRGGRGRARSGQARRATTRAPASSRPRSPSSPSGRP